MKNIIQKISLLVLTSTFTLLLLEFIVRFFFPQNLYPYVYKDDPLVSYRLRENYQGIHKAPEFRVKVETNSYGLRDYEHSITNSENFYRIMVLGDSFTFGEGVAMDESYPKVMERRLNAVGTNKQYEVINISAFDWSSFEEYLYLKHYSARFKPDMVVIGFFIGNDIYQNRSGLFEIDSGQIIYSENESTNKRLNRILKLVPGYMYVREKSELLALLRKRIHIYLQSDSSKISSEIMRSLFNGEPNEDALIAIEATEGLMKEVKKLSEERGFEFVLLLIPASEQLEPRKVDLPHDVKIRFPNQLMKKIGEKHDMPVIDLLPDFLRESSGGKEFYYKINDHWNREGHLLAGEVLAERILPLLTIKDN